MMITDLWFYLLSVPAVLLYGIGKGGLGGALGVIAVPLMAVAVPPAQAAAVLLPILCVMDGFAVKQHYRNADYLQLRMMLPGAVAGVAIAGVFMATISPAAFAVVVGLLCVLFSLQYFLQKETKTAKGNAGHRGASRSAGKVNRLKAGFWSILSGFSSTTIHAGGGPASIYLLPLQLEKVTLVATMAVFFATVNLIKLIPFILVGEFDRTNLLTALILMPLAPVDVRLGVWLLHRVSQTVIYQLCYVSLLLSGCKLIWDGW